jgi:predicted metal-dependent enzyme (double-stranded beta helix superfamily)
MGCNVTQPLTAAIQVGPAQLARITSRTAGQPGQWLSLVRYDASERWYRRLVLTEQYEVWLLSWLPGQQTGFHDHGPSAGAFAIALGRLRERAAPAGRADAIAKTVLRGAVRSFGPDYIHDVRNDSAQPAVSIHAYSPPLTSMRRFDVAANGLLLATVEERSW